MSGNRQPTERVGRCEACGKVVAGIFPMHACVPDGEERFSIARWRDDEDEIAAKHPAEARGLTKAQAAIWLSRQADPADWAVTRWESDTDDPFGGAGPSGTVAGDEFAHDNDAHAAIL